MLGHWRPLFLRFARGGKMVATCGGVVLGVAPIVALAGAGPVARRVSRLPLRLARLDGLGVRAAGARGALRRAVAGSRVRRARSGRGRRPAPANIRRLLSGTENRFHLRRRKRAAAGV
jgi:hypothetical protein